MNKGGLVKRLPTIVWSILFVLSISSIAGAAPPIEKMKASTVRIVCENGSGSGFVIDNGHKVVTNWHVVQREAQRGTVGVYLGGTDVIPAKVTWRSERIDLAILEVSKKHVLMSINGEFASNIIELGEVPLTIGRDPRSSQLVFPKTVEKISRRHCTVWYDADVKRFFIEDCGSENGTFLENGKRISANKKIPLESGVRFYLSDKRQLFEVRLKDVADLS